MAAVVGMSDKGRPSASGGRCKSQGRGEGVSCLMLAIGGGGCLACLVSVQGMRGLWACARLAHAKRTTLPSTCHIHVDALYLACIKNFMKYNAIVKDGLIDAARMTPHFAAGRANQTRAVDAA